jgi:ribosomal protein S18 acetylase RimI-like enzyme
MAVTTLRTADMTDLGVVLEMMVDFNGGEGIPWTPERGEGPLCRLIGDFSLGTVGLAEVDQIAVGYYVVTWGYDLEWDGRDAFLTELYLRPVARRRSLGRALLDAAERAAIAAGARALHLMVRHENTSATSLYESAGYMTPERRFMTKLLRAQ